MRRGPTLLPAAVVLALGAVVLLVAEATWLRTLSAVVLMAGIALGVAAVATPEFLERDHDSDEGRH